MQSLCIKFTEYIVIQWNVFRTKQNRDNRPGVSKFLLAELKILAFLQNIINVISQWIWWKRRRFYVICKEIFFIKNIWAILRDRKWYFPRTTDTILFEKDRNRDRCQERIIELAMRYKMLLFIHLLYGFNFSCSTL